MNRDRVEKKSMGFTEMKSWLRHRHPMILLDRVVDHEPGQFLTGLISISGSSDSIAGHFPERAIYPGSNLIQAFAQSGILLLQFSTSRLGADELTLVVSVSARFYRVVVPGDRVELHTRLDRSIGTSFSFSGEAVVDGVRVAALRSTLVRADVRQLGNPLW